VTADRSFIVGAWRTLVDDDRKSAALVVICALTTRVLAAVVLPDQSALLPDAISYREAAAHLAAHWRIDNPFEMPLYPLLIAITGPGYPQLAADIVLSALTALITRSLALEIFKDRQTATIAGLAVAFYPPLIFISVTGLSETLFIFLVLSAFLFWYRAQFVAAAICAVLAILTRPVLDAAAPLLVVYFAAVIHRQSAKQTIRHVLSYAAIYVALMSPWWVHNYRAYHEFVWLTPGFGTALYAGNNSLNHSGGGNIGEDYDTTAFDAIRDPVARDRALRDAAINFIWQNPGRFVELAAKKFVRMWRLWPHHPGYSGMTAMVLTFLSITPVILLASAFLLFLMPPGMLMRSSPILLFIAYYTAVHMIIVGTIRYRLPLEPFLIMFAAATVADVIRRLLHDRMESEGLVEAK